jgi:hypothetical protein
MKAWIDNRIQEMKSHNVIPLDNWREYYNNSRKETGRSPNASQTQTLDNSGRGDDAHHK